jgi:monoamine oxidase
VSQPEAALARDMEVDTFPTHATGDNGDALREPIGPIHGAGAETATVWNGYMDGAVQSGGRAARQALTQTV